MRFLADGTDCTDPGILGGCEVSASIARDWYLPWFAIIGREVRDHPREP